MIKFDKEYSTQYFPEIAYLSEHGIYPSYIKNIGGARTYKYAKTSRLFEVVLAFYRAKEEGEINAKH